MNFTKILLLGILILNINACKEDRFTETNPVMHQVDIDQNDFFMKGTFNDKAFEINHIGLHERNYNSNFFITSDDTGLTFFKSVFDKGEIRNTHIGLSITSDNELDLEDVLSVGTYNWTTGEVEIDWSNGNNDPIYVIPIGKAHLERVEIDNQFYDVFPNSTDFVFNKMEVTNFEPITVQPEDPAYDTSYKNKLYKVEGNFQAKLVNEEGELFDFIIDEFSMMFSSR